MNLSDAVTAVVLLALGVVAVLIALGPVGASTVGRAPSRPDTPAGDSEGPASPLRNSCRDCPHTPHDPGRCEHETTDGPVRTSCGCDAGVGLQKEGIQ